MSRVESESPIVADFRFTRMLAIDNKNREIGMNETEYALGAHCGVAFAGIKAASLFNLKRGARTVWGDM